MAGTKEGGRQTYETTVGRHGPDFYSKIGKRGAEAYTERLKQGIAKPRGFAVMSKEKRRQAALKGGATPRSTKTHCARGHEYTEGSYVIYTVRKTGYRYRSCRACQHENERRKREKRKAMQSLES